MRQVKCSLHWRREPAKVSENSPWGFQSDVFEPSCLRCRWKLFFDFEEPAPFRAVRIRPAEKTHFQAGFGGLPHQPTSVFVDLPFPKCQGKRVRLVD